MITIEEYTANREPLRWLFELAEDSEAELRSYLHRGRVLIARVDGAGATCSSWTPLPPVRPS